MTQTLSKWQSTSQTPKSAKVSLLKSERGNAELKFVRVQVEGQTQVIFLPAAPVTCGWLLNRVKGLFNNSSLPLNPPERRVVAVRTENQAETLDYYLTQLDRYTAFNLGLCQYRPYRLRTSLWLSRAMCASQLQFARETLKWLS